MVAECARHEGICKDVDHHAEQLDDHEERIRTLEKAHWKMTGWISLAAGIFAAVGSVAGGLLK